MGMDYVGQNGNDFHLNWSGHTYMAQLLDMLGADLLAGGWSGSNDGDEITPTAAIYWADLLDDALKAGKIKERKIATARYAGGFQYLPHVDEPKSTEYRDMYAAMEASFRSKDKDVAIAEVETIEPISEETSVWIKSFATFLRDSGGAAQF